MRSFIIVQTHCMLVFQILSPYQQKRGSIKFYMSISNRPITIIRGDSLKSISFFV